MNNVLTNGARVLNADAQGLISLSMRVYAVEGKTATLLKKPKGATALHLLTENGAFRGKPGDHTGLAFTVNATSKIATANGHGFVDGEGPYHVESDGTLPDGLAAEDEYFIVPLTANTFMFAESHELAMKACLWRNANPDADAKDNPYVVKPADAGSGSHSFLALADAPDSSVEDGTASLPLPAYISVVAPDKLTVQGGDAGHVLIYWWT